MSRVIVADFLKDLYAQETGVVPILLVTITHEQLPEPIRLSTDPTQRIPEFTTASRVVYGTVSRGQTFVFYPMSLTLPSDSDNGPKAMSIEIDNVHRDITVAVRSLFTPPKFNVEIITSDSLNTVVAEWPEYLLTNITVNASTVSGKLELETLTNEPYPSGTFNPSMFPGLF